MELIQSFIAILEAAAERQASQEAGNSTITAHQPTESQQAAAVEALLFPKPVSVVQNATQVDTDSEHPSSNHVSAV